MSDIHLYALSDEGPRRLVTPEGVNTLHGLEEPDGIYEGLRTFGRARFLFLDRHLARAQRSMSALGWSEPLDEALVRRGLDEVTRASLPEVDADEPARDATIRIDVFERPVEVFGTKTRYLIALSTRTPVPKEVLENGVEVGVARGMTRYTPRIKRNEWITRRRGAGPGDHGYYEHLLLDEEERILEGSSSNVFCVRDGVLLTAHDDVLSGIQRGVILELAEREGIEVREEAVPLADVEELDEMFLTSSSRGAVPIVVVEGRPVGAGKPGPVWRRLFELYVALAAEARPAIEAASERP